MPQDSAPIRYEENKIPVKTGGYLITPSKENPNGAGAKKGKPRIGTIFEKLLGLRHAGDATQLGIDLSKMPAEDVFLLTNAEVIALQIITKACRGDLSAAQMIYDRTEGKPVQVNHNVNAEISYTDFLNKLAEDERQAVEDLLS